MRFRIAIFATFLMLANLACAAVCAIDDCASPVSQSSAPPCHQAPQSDVPSPEKACDHAKPTADNIKAIALPAPMIAVLDGQPLWAETCLVSSRPFAQPSAPGLLVLRI